MGSSTKEEYAAFLMKVKRTVCIDNLSPQVTESILKNAIDQFGTVKSVEFIPNYTEAGNVPQSALVELESPIHAKQIKEVISGHPFMVFGMPRPVRARLASPEMFNDRPREPGRKIKMRWVERNDPDFEVALRIKRRVKEHAAEASFLLKVSLIPHHDKLYFFCYRCSKCLDC